MYVYVQYNIVYLKGWLDKINNKQYWNGPKTLPLRLQEAETEQPNLVKLIITQWIAEIVRKHLPTWQFQEK